MRPGLILGAALGLLALAVFPAPAAPPTSIVPNGFGTSVSNAGGIYDITGGFAPGNGSNLFHSFSTFNIGTGDTADFDVSSNVTNIIARVTGGASTIDGTITSTVGPNGPVSNANLFLINPAGIMFTANASLNLNGAFVASTANYIKFSDGSQFYGDLTHPLNDAGLTSAPVSAFGFISSTPAPISFEGTQFLNYGGIHVIGGDITLDQATALLAPGGNLTLFSAASAGEVPFSLDSPGSGFASATNPSFGNITIENDSNVANNGYGGGNIVIRGGQIVVDYAGISSNNYGDSTGGGISVQATNLAVQDYAAIVSSTYAGGNGGDISVVSSGGVTLASEGQIGSFTEGGGAGGNISIQAASLNIVGEGLANDTTGISSLSDTSATGNGGSVSVTTTGPISMQGGGEISTVALSSGNAGDVTVNAASLSLDSTGSAGTTGIFSDVGIAPYNTSMFYPASSGNSGAMMIGVSGAITMLGGSVITTDNFGQGNAGNLSVHAATLDISASGIASDSGSPSTSEVLLEEGLPLPTGSAANITITVDGFLTVGGDGSGIISNTFTNGPAGGVTVHAGAVVAGTDAEIGSDTSGGGNAGDVLVEANSLAVDQATVSSTSFGSFGAEVGNAGSVTVEVDGPATLSVGLIDTDSFSSGDAGAVTLTAASLTIDGGGIISRAYGGPTSTGIAGSINVAVSGALRIEQSGGISADTTTAGHGGSVTVRAGSLSVSSTAASAKQDTIPAGVSATATASGDGGDVMIDAGTIILSGGGATISASSQISDAGNVTVHANELTLVNGGTIATSGLDGGSITLDVHQLVYLAESSITTDASGGESSFGGDITIDPVVLALDDSTISANDPLGSGGKILIVADELLNQFGGDFLSQSQGDITATGGVSNGSISISAPDLDLSGSLLPLPAVLVSDENRLKETCARAIGHEYSSLIVVGRGGTELAPDELQPDFGVR